MDKPGHVSELHVYEIGGIDNSQRRDFPIILRENSGVKDTQRLDDQKSETGESIVSTHDRQ
jgi:hypothetical protein